tara:strand:+ start:238 stop:705 length:468 start_codon:yes stop_codon:yes gene_type:complete
MIHIYTDGSSLGNPGPGGYGFILEWVEKKYHKEFSKGFRLTTNNRMELLAVIESLEFLKKKPLDVIIFSDSKYVIDSVEKKWLFNWENKKFKGKKNSDLWKRFLLIYREHNVKFEWIKGHNNHPQNECCDKLAVKAAKSNTLYKDDFFENQIKQV